MSQRILIAPEWHPWPEAPVEGSWGKEQARAAALSNDVVVMTTRPGRVTLRPRFAFHDELEEGIRTLRVRYTRHPVPKVSFLVRLRAMELGIRRLRETGFVPDLIHAKVFAAGFPSLLLGRQLDVPVVVSEHYTAFPRGTLTRWDKVIARWTFRHAARVCPDSADLGTHVSRVQPRARVVPMPNVVDTRVFFPQNGRAAADGPVRILNVASLDDKKGHEHLLRALEVLLRRLPDARLAIVGGGPRLSELELLAQRLGVARSVDFLGFRDRYEIAELMRGADLFALSSLWENAPHVVIEALASGLPVVATDVGGVSELLEGLDFGLVPPADHEALAEALLAGYEQRRQHDPAELVEHARERFGHEAVGRRWDHLYSEVLEDHRSATG